MRLARLAFGALALTLVSAAASAAEPEAAAGLHVDGAALGLAWIVPFVGILLSIALLPLLAPRLWHHHFGKISAFWALAFLVPFGMTFGPAAAAYEVTHTFLLEYLPFIVLLFALYTISGGVRVVGALPGTPAVNTGLLALGTLAANVMGTTGAAMLLIRPLLQANAERRHNVHVVVFFIFLVANIGGSLSPLGDPPLFLGFLKGVHFFWPTEHLFVPLLLVAGILLAVFFVLDSYFFAREPRIGAPERLGAIKIEGGLNLLFLLGVVGAVLLSGVWKSGLGITVYHVRVGLPDLVRDALLVALAFASLRFTRSESRAAQGFTWFPMIEVAELFAAIFLTIIPVLAILRAGEAGALAPIIGAMSNGGEPVHALYFWVTGALSSFLDNAPTYLVFFNMAGGDPQVLMGPEAPTLLAISAGAVFMGAMTYIGNAPNFMVRAIAVERGVKMPSFFGYMLWSLGFLAPVFLLATVVFFI
jgi:Na+/H+ antiporter NhaD/arsenite permease-like protein